MTATGAPIPQAATRARLARWLARAGWSWLAPLLLAGLAMRFLVPGRAEATAGFWGWLARLGDEHPLPIAVGLFLLFGVLIRHHADRLPGGSHLRSAAPPDAKAGVSWPWRATAFVSTILIAAAAALGLRALVGQPYRVASASMLPTLEPSDYLLVNRRARQLGRGDVVVFPGSAVGDRRQAFIVKRVIGLPGDRVTSSGGLVRINGWQVPFCDAGKYVAVAGGQGMMGRLVVEFLADRSYLTVHTADVTGYEGPTVPAGALFVMGDNRGASADSRSWNPARGGGVPLATVQGKVWRVLGADRDGHLDPARLLRQVGAELHLAGIDVRAAQERIARCLQKRPAQTWPPPASGG